MERAPKTAECQAPVFAPAHGTGDLNAILSAVDLDEIFSREFLLPEGVNGPRRPVPERQAGGVLQRTLEVMTPQGSAPMSLLELCTPQTMPPEPPPPGSSGSPAPASSQAASLAAVERAAALLGMAVPSARKRPRTADSRLEALEEDGITGDAADRVERRLRNREHAKRSRLRKKFMLESLQNQLAELRDVNARLRRVVKLKLGDRAAAVLDACTEAQSSILVADPNTDAKPLRNDDADTTTVNIMEQDYRLIHSLQASQQCFAISDPSLPDNPIVFASPGFVKLTGYTMQQILGRNCRFLQGPGTDQRSVQMIRDAILEERDVSVCLLNYKSDGTPFWNQFFIAPLRACDGAVVNFVGVQCEVNAAKPEDMMQRVKRIKNIENLE